MGDPARPMLGPGGGRPMRIGVLFVEGCPNSLSTFELVRWIAAAQRPDAVIERIEVASQQEAARLRFLGSPTVQVNGIDIEPTARERTSFGMMCRLYGDSGVPNPELVESAIREAACCR